MPASSNEEIPLKDIKDNTKVVTTAKVTADSDSVNSGQFENVNAVALKKNGWQNFCDSFRQAQVSVNPSEGGVPDTDLESGEQTSEKSKIGTLASNFIALGGGLGTGLLVGTGMALSIAGPLGLLIANTLTSVMIILTLMGAGELAISYPTLAGGFNAYPSILVDPSLAFSLAWGYCINWLLVLPLEMVTASMTIKYWNNTISPAVFITIFLILIYAMNFIFGAKGYSTIELGFCTFKILMFSSFIVISAMALAGRFPKNEHIGIQLYSKPGCFANGFKGICACFVTSAFSLGGTEAMVLTAADQKNPIKAIPKALKFVGYRVTIFYILAVVLLGLMIAYDSPALMGSSHSSNSAPVSPFVLAVSATGLNFFNHIYNTIILCAVVSVGNAAFYASSRTLHSLAVQGYNFKCFTYQDRANRPLVAMVATAFVGLFSYIACYEDQEKIFTWLLSLSGMSTIFTWMSINISHICFYRALKAQGVNRNTLGYRAPFGIIGSYISLIFYFFVCVVYFWTALFPIGYDGKPDFINFFQNYMGLFTFLALYLIHKIFRAVTKKKFILFYIPPRDVDLNVERKINEREELDRGDEETKEEFKNLPFYKKIIDWLF